MSINYLAILTAVVASFVWGWIWYGMLFMKPWVAAIGMKVPEKSERKMPVGPMALSIVTLAIMAVGLSGIIGHIGVWDIQAGLISGAAIWLAFVITTMSVNNAYPGRPVALTLIDGGHWLTVLLIQGAVIGAFGV